MRYLQHTTDSLKYHTTPPDYAFECGRSHATAIFLAARLDEIAASLPDNNAWSIATCRKIRRIVERDI